MPQLRSGAVFKSSRKAPIYRHMWWNKTPMTLPASSTSVRACANVAHVVVVVSKPSSRHLPALVGLAAAATACSSSASSIGAGAAGFLRPLFATARTARTGAGGAYQVRPGPPNDPPTPATSNTNTNIRIQPRHRRLLDQITANLANSTYQNIVVINGAGVSTSCGIPDFRTPGTGLYSKLEEYNLPYPEAIFELDYFRSKPQAFATLAKEIWPGQVEGPRPSRTHAFLKVLEDKGMLQRVYTQSE